MTKKFDEEKERILSAMEEDKKCPDCEYVKSFVFHEKTCTQHAPEYIVRVEFPL